MTTINKYRINCTTDGDTFVWAETEPTTCPVNTSHTIVSADTTIVDLNEPDVMTIKEESTPTQGFYRFQGYKHSIPASDPVGNVSTNAVTFPFPTSIINGWFYASESQVGDRVDAVIGENTIVGTITANVANTDTTLNVSSTVIDNAEVGWDINLFNGVVSEDLGRVLSKDVGNSQIIVENGAVNNFNAAPPTYVRLAVNTIDCMHINVPNVRYAFAEKKLGGRYLPANTTINIKYTNNEGNAKSFVYNLEYLY